MDWRIFLVTITVFAMFGSLVLVYAELASTSTTGLSESNVVSQAQRLAQPPRTNTVSRVTGYVVVNVVNNAQQNTETTP